MSDNLRDLYGHPRHRPLVETIAKLGGLTTDDAGFTDADGRIDTDELVRQRANRDMARELIKRMGWCVTVTPPTKASKRSQQLADSEPGGSNA